MFNKVLLHGTLGNLSTKALNTHKIMQIIEIDFHKGQETILYGKWLNQRQMITRIYDLSHVIIILYIYTHIYILIYVHVYIEGGGGEREREHTCSPV